eukprot:5720365-Pyramimonas_sp.AAC.1
MALLYPPVSYYCSHVNIGIAGGRMGCLDTLAWRRARAVGLTTLSISSATQPSPAWPGKTKKLKQGSNGGKTASRSGRGVREGSEKGHRRVRGGLEEGHRRVREGSQEGHRRVTGGSQEG